LASTVALTLAGTLVAVPSAQAAVEPSATTLSRQAGAEGIVLLRNDNQVLPLSPERVVSVFGRIQIDYNWGGWGAAAVPNAPTASRISLLQGLRNNPGITVNETLASVYTQWCNANPVTQITASQYWQNQVRAEMPVDQALVDAAADASDTVIVVIGRNAGEGNTANDDWRQSVYELQPTEEDMLAKVTATFDKVIAYINTSNVMDLSWVDDYDIDGLLVAWQGGGESGNAAADVLSGDVTPSGKLADTFAKDFADYPTQGNYGDPNMAKYVEDIFVGYRYFETFAQDRVLFPFGYGLSYTTFSLQHKAYSESGGAIAVRTRVTNTGQYPGKEVVQVYYGAPQGKLGKAARSLVAYAKTRLLQPGEYEDVTLTFGVDKMSSFDDGGYTVADGGSRSAWVLEAGDYPIYVGNSVRAAVQRGTHNEPATRVVEQAEETSAMVGKIQDLVVCDSCCRCGGGFSRSVTTQQE
jgi:hypothetical protein